MLADCLKKAGKNISAKDAQAIQDLAAQKIESGIDEVLAEAQAVREFLSGIDAEINDLTTKIQKAGGEVKKQKEATQGDELNQDQTQTDYRIDHTAPLKDGNNTIDNLSDIYPDDIYDASVSGRFYGHGDPAIDGKTARIIASLKGKPDKLVTIYRAVPFQKSSVEQAEDLDDYMDGYLKRSVIPSNAPNPKNLKGSDWYDWAYDERDRLRSEKKDAFEITDINAGDWVTVNRDYAKEHGEAHLDGYKIISKKVKAKHIATDGNSMHEWGYDPDEGKTLKQDTLNDQARGSIQLLNGERIIRLTEASDLSTFLHESAHLFLEMEKEFSKEFGLTDDQKTTLEFLGVESFEDIDPRTDAGVEAHEKFARAFELYLYEGKAPSSKLREAFRKFKTWMKQIYQSFSALNVELNDDIRQVFDRMLATEEEIKAMEAEMQYSNQFEAPQAPESKATQKAQETLEQKILGQLQRQHQKWWKQELGETKKALKEKFLEQANYRAEYAMRGSSSIEGIDRIDQAQLKELLGGKIPQRLRGISRKGGQDIDEVAFAMGYHSAYEMLVDIRDSEPLSKAVDAEADADMLRKHGDIMNDGTLEEEARNAVRNEERAKILLKELREANKRARKPNDIDRQALQQAAKDTVANLTEKQLMGGMVERYHRAEVKSAIESQRLKDSDPVGAARAKAQQAFNFYLYREARDARNKVEKQRAFLRKMQTRKYSPKQVNPDYIQNIKRYLAAFDFRKNPNFAQRRSELAQVASWIASQESTDGGFIPQITDPKLKEISDAFADGTLDNVDLKSYRDMTIGEIQSVYDMAKHLRFIGGKLSESEKQKKLRYFEGLANSIRDNWDGKTHEDGTLADSISKNAKSFLYNVVFHADSVLRRLDGFANGAMIKAVKRPIDKAVTEKLLPMQEKAGDEISSLYSEFYTDKEIKQNGKKVGIEGTTLSMKKWEMIAIALNMGNSGNRQALLDSGQFDEAQLELILNQLDKKDLDFVQAVWDYVETYKPMLGEVERRRTGVSPKWVESEPLKTKHGTYRGGYYPLKYDPEKSYRVTEEDAAQMMDRMSLGRFAKAQTKDGMTIERVGSGGRPVNLDMMVFHQHINETINFIAMSEAVDEAQSVLSSKAIREAMEETGNIQALKSLDIWLKDTAVGEVVGSDGINKFLRGVRTGFSASKLGFNVGTMLMQPLGVLQTMPVIGYRNTLKGVYKLLQGTRFMGNDAILEVQRISPFMRERGLTFNKDIRDTINKVNNDPSKPNFIPDWFRQSMFAGIVYTQKFVDTATWLGAYEKAKNEAPEGSESDFIQEADRAVARAQASGNFSDRTPIERGTISAQTRQAEFVRIWTALGSYFFAKANVAQEVIGRTNFKSPKELGRFIVDMMMLFSVEAILVGLLRNTIPDEDDEETFAEFAIKETGLTMMASIPFVREAGSELSGFRGGSAISSLYADIGKAAKQLSQGELDAPAVKSINNLVGTAFRLPSSATNRFGESLSKQIEGEDVDPLDYLIWREKE